MYSALLRLEKVTKNYAVFSDANTGFGKLYLPLEQFGGAVPAFLAATLSPTPTNEVVAHLA
jgi:hypothetical protein